MAALVGRQPRIPLTCPRERHPPRNPATETRGEIGATEDGSSASRMLARVPAVAREPWRHSCADDAVGPGAVRARATASERRGRSPWRDLQLRERFVFPGKLAYARRFARPPDPSEPVAAGGVLVITSNAGLRAVDTPVTMESFRAFAVGEIDLRNAAHRAPLEQSAKALREAIGPDCEVVLLGSVASGKLRGPPAADLRRAPDVPARFRRARRHEPRRIDAPLRRSRLRIAIRASVRRGETWPAAARSWNHEEHGARLNHEGALSQYDDERTLMLRGCDASHVKA